MSKVHEKMQQRAESTNPEDYRTQMIAKAHARSALFGKLFASKEFQEYLKFEEEMYNPEIVVAYKCTDATCESMKKNIRLFRQRRKALDSTRTKAHGQSHS